MRMSEVEWFEYFADLDLSGVKSGSWVDDMSCIRGLAARVEPLGSQVVDAGGSCGSSATLLARLGYRVEDVEIDAAGTNLAQRIATKNKVELHIHDGLDWAIPATRTPLPKTDLVFLGQHFICRGEVDPAIALAASKAALRSSAGLVGVTFLSTADPRRYRNFELENRSSLEGGEWLTWSYTVPVTNEEHEVVYFSAELTEGKLRFANAHSLRRRVMTQSAVVALAADQGLSTVHELGEGYAIFGKG